MIRERNEALGSVRIGAGLVEFFDDSLRKFTAFSALAGYTELCSKVRQIIRTTTTQVANLVIGNLSANAYVHGLSSVWRYFK